MSTVISGVTDFPTTNPELLSQWDYEKNEVDPTTVSKGSDVKRWWLCSEFKHSHLVAVSAKTKPNPTKCPVCKGRVVLSGFNDLQTKHPDVASEWDYDLNETTPDLVAPSTHKAYFWKCKNFPHSYLATCNDKTKPSRPGCPYCFGNKVLEGFNDIATTDPLEASFMISPDPKTVSRGYKDFGEFQCKNEPHTFKCRIRDKFTHNISCPVCYGRVVDPEFNAISLTDPYILDEWDYDRNTKTPDEFVRGSNKSVWLKCSKKPHSYQRTVYDRIYIGLTCPECVKSSGESELVSFVRNIYSGEIITSDRKKIYPKELDIFLPELNLAIEYNGVYYHSDLFKESSYHKDKLDLCRAVGITLIQIWEDDWKLRRTVVENMLRHKLGQSLFSRVPARKTYVCAIDPKQSNEFLDKNHIQKSSTGSVRLALRESRTDTIVAVMVFKRTKDTLTLERYATSCIVAGGQSKLLKYIDKNISYTKMVTFADLCISDGTLYEDSGWIHDGEIAPDYRYLYRGERKHKFGFRLQRFREDPTLIYKEGLSEYDLAILNGIPRVFDAGKIRYVRYP